MAPRTFPATLLWLIAFMLSIPVAFGASIESCPGYKASNVEKTTGKITADLTLAGDSCNLYGTDLENLRLLVEYQSSKFTSEISSEECAYME